MIRGLRNLWDGIRGNGEHAITTPPMDGVLQPNNLIEEAALLAAVEAPDNLVASGAGLLFSSGNRVMRVSDGKVEDVVTVPAAITAMAASVSGTLAIATADGTIRLRGDKGEGKVLGDDGMALGCVTALCFADETTLLVCRGSSKHTASDWKRDLMERNALGAVLRIDLESGQSAAIAENLAFPYGILPIGASGCIVSESWRSRLIRIDPRGAVSVVLSDLPGYPARLSPKTGGGAWLAVFAPRSQLMEFILREKRFREQMMATIAPDLWIAPSLTAPHSFLEPLQGGGLKQLGVMKPWAPTRSFGLVVALDAAFQPNASWHSRADGTRHGVTSVVEQDGRPVAASKGGNALIDLMPGKRVQP